MCCHYKRQWYLASRVYNFARVHQLATFFEFVKMLLQKGTLQRGDIFVVDNCTIHTKGDNIAIQETLFRNYQILMIPLPPYHPDLNPTELVFNTLLQRLMSERS